MNKMKKLLSLLVGVMLVCSFGVCLAEELQPVPIIIDSPPYCPTVGTITIAEGWNLVAMPVLPAEPYTVEKFIKDVETDPSDFVLDIYPRQPSPDIQTGWQIPVVAVYKNGQFERYPKEGVTYNMVPGEAYFVYARYNGPRPLIYPPGLEKVKVDVIGKPLDVPVSLALNRGWNGVSVLKPGTSDLRGLSDELAKQGIKATRIAMWSAKGQEWSQHELPILEKFLRVINPDEGLFLLCEENGLFIPGLPPVPPERLSYTGKIEYAIWYLDNGLTERIAGVDFIMYTQDGKTISLAAANKEIYAKLEAAIGNGLFTVTGIQGIEALVVDAVGPPILPFPPKPPVEERTILQGKIGGVFYIPEAVPPYKYMMVTVNGTHDGLKGINEDVEAQLDEAAQNNTTEYIVEGTKITTTTTTMLPPYTQSWTYLLVDRVGIAVEYHIQ